VGDSTLQKAFGAPEDGATQTISLSGTAAAVTIDTKSLYKLTATSACHVIFTAGGSADATTSDDYLVADVPYWYGTDSSLTRISAIQNASSGTLYITKLSERTG
jgi:hypothetical protein